MLEKQKTFAQPFRYSMYPFSPKIFQLIITTPIVSNYRSGPQKIGENRKHVVGSSSRGRLKSHHSAQPSLSQKLTGEHNACPAHLRTLQPSQSINAPKQPHGSALTAFSNLSSENCPWQALLCPSRELFLFCPSPLTTCFICGL